MKILTPPELSPRERRLMAEGGGLYHYPVRTPSGGISCAFKLLFHWALIHDLHDYGYEDRWCYRTEAEVIRALMFWNGEDGTEPAGWHKHPGTHRVREDSTVATDTTGR